MKEGGHEPVFIESFFLSLLGCPLNLQQKLREMRKKKKKVVFTDSKSLRHSLNGHPRMQTGMRAKKSILYQENT